VAATNSYGTTDGYDSTFITAASEAPPTNITPALDQRHRV